MAKQGGPRRPPGRPPKGEPHAIDKYVGDQVKVRRNLVGMSQEKLGEALGVTFQQVQKYERGSNRISASRLWEMAQVFKIPVGQLYPQSQSPGLAEDGVPYQAEDPMTRPETIRLVKAFHQIQDPKIRKRVYELIRVLAPAAQAEDGADDD